MRGIIIALMLLPMTLWAQGRKKTAEVDTVKVAFLNGVSLQADLFGALQTQISDHGHYEVGMRLNLKDRYYPILEMGRGQANQKEEFNEQHTFSTKAPYFRAGVDYNLLKNKHDDYKVFVGARYGFTSYNYEATFNEKAAAEDTETDDNIQKLDADSDEQPAADWELIKGNAKNHWLELVFGVDAKIKGPLHLGWDIRYKRPLKRSYTGKEEPWCVPGFGNYKKVLWGGRFYISIAI